MHVAINGWFWDQEFNGSAQYLRQLLATLRQLDPELRLTLIIPDNGPVDAVPEGVDLVKVRLLVGGHLGKKVVHDPRALRRGFPDREPADGIAVELNVLQFAQGSFPQGFENAPLHDAE